MAVVLHRVDASMSTRKSRPHFAQEPVTSLRVIPHVPRHQEVGDVTVVDARRLPPPRTAKQPPAPTGSRSGAPLPSILSGAATPAPTNVIPFAKPRAISSLPVEFNKIGSTSAPPSNTPPVVGGGGGGGGSWGSAAVAAATSPARAPQPQYQAPAPLPKPPLAKPPQTAYPQPQQQQGFRLPPAPQAPVVAPPPPPPAAPSQDRDFDQEAKTVFTPPPVMDAPAAPSTSRWAMFEQLGLKAPQLLDRKKLSGHVVNAYRLLGFVILSIIVVVLIGYLVTTAFFY